MNKLKYASNAKYTGSPSPHFSLGASQYTHSTSPIRRYADLCVQRQIKQFLNPLQMLPRHSVNFTEVEGDSLDTFL